MRDRIMRFYKRYEHYFTSVSFLLGFIWDNITLRRIDLLYENLTFIWNLTLVTLVITVMNLYEAGKLRHRFTEKVVPYLPMALQFAFGGLFSAFIVFYVKSGTIFVSWPFLLLLGGLFVGNEFFRKRYVRFTFQMSIFFIALFSYAVFLLPVLFRRIDTWIFLASGASALFLVCCIAFAFLRVFPEQFRSHRKMLFFSIAGIYLFFQVMYFAHILPPIPLAIKEMEIYHSMERTSEKGYLYEATFEKSKGFFSFRQTSDTFHVMEGERIYAYNAVFAPSRIKVDILHRWSYFDEEQHKWIEAARIGFPITGGRDKGYRGYTFLRKAHPGKWRVTVITSTGQVLGRRSFRVVESQTPPLLETVLK